jgi:hypothetical protein
MTTVKQKAAGNHKYGKRELEPWKVTFGIPDDGMAPAKWPGSSGNTSDSGIAFNSATSNPGPKKITKCKYFTRNTITNLFEYS